ncbi:PREDICTED: uncharacterized protein LOC104823979 [Tarenaya hassleriana]|uniref:uncharacterized protein LOC104823979 n=1 Tax=Tarenaya hassleriana TaxID=28532 RepID=UPI00053C526A|nr:PREDICTED: uncharacterized protein LOC104823979 [Tarenaya hassleriana]
MASTLSLSSFISFISPYKLQTKAPLPSNLPLPFPAVSHRRRNYLTVASMAAEEPASTYSSGSMSSELASVIYPSLAYANTLFFSSGYNVQVLVDENEPEERLLNRFRREVMRAGVIQECKRRRFFENKQDEKKRRTRDAAKRNRKRRPQSRFSQQNKEEAPKSKTEDEDNWDMPDGDTPY